MRAEDGIIQAFLVFLGQVIDLFWTVVSWIFDAMRTMGPLTAALVILGILFFCFTVAQLMQGRINGKLDEKPGDPVNMILHELIFTIPGIIVSILLLPFILIRNAGRSVRKRLDERRKEREKKKREEEEQERKEAALRGEDIAPAPDAADGAEGDEEGTEREEDEEPGPVLVATLGPSFLGAAVITALIYLAGLITEPLIRLQFGLSEGLPAWQYLILGERPELQWYIPLSKFPWMGVVLTLGFWTSVWVWTGRIIRLVLMEEVGQNLISRRDDEDTLSLWRTWFGATQLWTTDDTYVNWARWLPVLSIPFMLASFGMLGNSPYRMNPSMFSVSLLLVFSWALHFGLQGLVREEDEEEEEEEPETIVARGWAEVLEDIQQRFQIGEPHVFDPPRKVEPLALSRIDPESEGIVSPLLTELLPEGASGKATFTHMQYVVLRALSLQGYVHTDPPLPKAELELGPMSTGAEDLTGMRHRNQIVLAPEGTGKSTMAMLAACNHAIVHTRSTLVVCRDEDRARRMVASMRRAIEPSTLRWNIRTRKIGNDLVNDLAQGIIPDIIVTSLHQLVVNVLDEPQTYTPFLENLGLIVVDDVEEFCGAVETHAQLAFRRLNLRVRDLMGVQQLGEESAPMVLVLGTDSMHDMPAWARTLCGVDAVARYFDYNTEEAGERDEAVKAFLGLAGGEGEGAKGSEAAKAAGLMGHFHLTYRLNDFRNADDEVLDVRDVIEACERLSVPWTYRPCGDGRRGLGRQRLLLRDEPKVYVPEPSDACVIFLQGHMSEVRREIERLNRAGSGFDPVTIKGADGQRKQREDAQDEGSGKKKPSAPPVAVAMITIIDRDEEMALTELNHQSTLSYELETLPRPVVRSPVGRVVQEHMAAEMTTSWVEVADVVDIFGSPSARTLTRLADAGLLMSEERVDLHPDVQQYERKVYVRATSRAMGSERRVRGLKKERMPFLPPKVMQVELPSGNRIAIRDRTNLTLIDVADADSADHVYYLGKIFENAQGRFVVVGRGRDEEDDAEDVDAQDVLVEPFLGEGISSPRRRVWFYHLDADEALRRHTAPRHEGMPAYAPKLSELPTIEPLLIGDFPIATSLGDVTCITEHVATFRLGPILSEVRQRTVFDREARVERLRKPLGSVALGIYPNPDVDFETSEDPPKLRLEEARLIASAMRAVLPTMYRGAHDSVEVALHTFEPHPERSYEFKEHEGFYLYDAHPGGNGASRAIHRDGVELLLRLCRVYIERVLYHDRLRARFDLWGDEREIMAHGEPGVERDNATGMFKVIDAEVARREWEAMKSPTDPVTYAETEGGAMRVRDREVRRRALIWLDSRLRPEGSLAGGRALGQYGSGEEGGEGDVSDIGRCWYSVNGGVTDLLWSKHRWRLDDEGGEAMVDLGFDRDTAATSRYMVPERPQLKPLLKVLSEQLENPAFQLDDQIVWGAPRAIWTLDANQDVAVGGNGELALSQPVRDYQLFLSAIAMHDAPALRPLAELLLSRSDADLSTLQGRYALISYMTKFVQGIPSAAMADPRGTAYTPVSTLLRRLGDADTKSIILATLLAHCGVDAGLFVSLEDGDTMCAAAALNTGKSSEVGGEAANEYVQAWRQQMGLANEDLMFGELAPRPGGPGGPTLVYVCVDPMTDLPPGRMRIEHPERWVFVPLSAVWFKLGMWEDEESEDDEA